MVGTPRRLDVCLGDFAVSIQGYDDPLAVLEEVLKLAQKAAAETPDLLNSMAGFDEATIGEVIERVARRTGVDADSFGAVPGLVLVHRGAETDGGMAAIRNAVEGGLDAAAEDEAEDHEAAAASTTAASSQEDDPIEALRRRFEERDEPEPDYGVTPEWDPAPALSAEAPAGDESEDDDVVVNIFAAPKPDAAAETPRHRPLFPPRPAGADPAKPVQMPEAPDRHVEGGILGDRFQNLLKRVHGRDAVPDAPEGKPKPAGAASIPGRDRMTPADVATAAGAEDANDAILSAAAFLTVIRRQARFTRRDIMKVVEDIPGEFPRTLETQIKGIGKLVRNGSLKRVDDDHYGLSRELIEKFEEVLRA